MADETAVVDYSDFESDERPSDLFNPLENLTQKARIAVIRTSDRILFKKCRRRWAWQSHLRSNLQPTRSAGPLWFGSGVHYALEDFHGENHYGHPWTAFKAFVKASKAYRPNSLPADYKELAILGRGMLCYYADSWLKGRDPLRTFVYNGIPQLEVNFRIPIPYDATKWGYDAVVYSGTIDRIVIDDNGNLWVMEYKTAKAIQTHHYEADPQVTTYLWAAANLYPGYNIMGVIYMQFKKTIPQAIEPLSSGKISTAKNLVTSHRLYRQGLIRQYGKDYWNLLSQEHKDFLNELAKKEDSEKDAFIRRDRIYRNATMCAAEGDKILMEVEDMLNPDLALYPNPVRECKFMCPFSSPCVSIDDGSDWEYEMKHEYEQRPKGYDEWRKFLPPPEALQEHPIPNYFN
jgi:hypothetical protein